MTKSTKKKPGKRKKKEQPRIEPPPGVDVFVRRNELPRLTGLHREHIRRLVIKGEFPAPIRITAGGRNVAWLASEIAQWQKDRASSANRVQYGKEAK